MTQPISVIAKSLVRERARTGLSLAEVARRAGIAKSTLSQLESGNGNPSLETLWSLCVALDIPFARLLEPQVNKTQVIRRGEGTKVVAEQAAILIQTPEPVLAGHVAAWCEAPPDDGPSWPSTTVPGPSRSPPTACATRGRRPSPSPEGCRG